MLRYPPENSLLLGKEGNRSGGTGVYLDNIYVILFIYDKLDIEQADDADAKTQLFGVFQDFALCRIGYGEGRGIRRWSRRSEHRYALHAHDAGYEYIVAVTNSVYLQFLTLNIFINQNRLILVNRYSCFQIGSQLISSATICMARPPRT